MSFFPSFFKNKDPYRIAVTLSSASVIFGLGREFLIVALLGFSAANDQLQIYLSIFYSLSLSMDAIRLAGLNLCGKAKFSFILTCATIVCAPFTIAVSLLMNYLVGGLNPLLLTVTAAGSFLNLITALIITYKQRYGAFLAAQIINVLPNFVLIPGIAVAYFSVDNSLVPAIICLCSLIPVVQLILLLRINVKNAELIEINKIEKPLSLIVGVQMFVKHGIAMLGEQLFQLTMRAVFFKVGAGYLSVLAISVRIYASVRFILIDSYIGSKLATWGNQVKQNKLSFEDLFKSKILQVVLLIASCWIIYIHPLSLISFAAQISSILIFSFYFSALVRIIYFKINRFEHNSNLIIKFGIYELLFAGVGYFLIKKFNLPVMIFMWLWYVAKPFAQLLLLRPRFYKLQMIAAG